MSYGNGPDNTMPKLVPRTTTTGGLPPFLAQKPDFEHDLAVGGGVIDASTVTAVNGKKLVPAGTLLRRNDTTHKYAPAAANDDGTGTRYAILLHDRDVTSADAAFEPLLKSWHLLLPLLPAAIPAAVLAKGDFRYAATSPVEAKS